MYELLLTFNFAAAISIEPVNNYEGSKTETFKRLEKLEQQDIINWDSGNINQIIEPICVESLGECLEINYDQPSSSAVSGNQEPLPLLEQLDSEEMGDFMIDSTWTPENHSSSDADSEPGNDKRRTNLGSNDIASGSGQRWKTAKPDTWGYNINVKKRNECLPYVDKKGKSCSAKSPQPINCTNCRCNAMASI